MTLGALSIAAAGGNALLRRIDAATANLAKAAAVGVRGTQFTSDEILETLLEPKTLKKTDRELDLAVEGEGFFRVLLPGGGVAFTRAGMLRRNAEGLLTTSEGLLLDPPVEVPPFITTLTVAPDGSVGGLDPEVPERPMPLGQIELSRFADPSGLEPLGAGLFRQTDAAGERQDGRPGEGLGTIRQGHLEESALDPMSELMELVHLQRAFELNNRVIQAADQILQSINSLRRKP